MENKEVVVKVRKKRRLRKGRVVAAVAMLLSIIVFCTIQVKNGLASNEEEIIKQEVVVVGKDIYEQKVEIELKDEDVDGFVYNENIPMSKEHQAYLYEKVQERNLDYNKVLALIETESGFRSNVISDTKDFGYFQINRINHEYLAEQLNTRNSPLNPYVNINWGTYLLSELYEYWGERGVTGEELDYHVWSSYNKGITGFKKHGMAVQYVSRIQSNLNNSSY